MTDRGWITRNRVSTGDTLSGNPGTSSREPVSLVLSRPQRQESQKALPLHPVRNSTSSARAVCGDARLTVSPRSAEPTLSKSLVLYETPHLASGKLNPNTAPDDSVDRPRSRNSSLSTNLSAKTGFKARPSQECTPVDSSSGPKNPNPALLDTPARGLNASTGTSVSKSAITPSNPNPPNR